MTNQSLPSSLFPLPLSLPPSPFPLPPSWLLHERDILLDRPVIIAILNVTPDSFSDGGRFLDPGAALHRVHEMIAEGADVIDVGGESTRPGAVPIDALQEIERIVPVIRRVRREVPAITLSVDTTRSEVARAALDAGADIVNDVSGLRRDPGMAPVIAEWEAGVILMHSRGGAGELASYAHATYGADVVGEVLSELGAAVQLAEGAGVARDAIVLDPGVGFAKRTEHSLAVLRGVPRFVATGFPVLIGASRKRVIEALTGESAPERRVDGTLGVHCAALALGARIFRVHDVRAHRHALDAAWAALAPGGTDAATS